MTQKNPIIIHGKQVGKFRASWLLLKESWRFLQSDKEMLLIPLIAFFASIFSLGLLFALFAIVLLSIDVTVFDYFTESEEESMHPIAYVFAFCVLVIMSLIVSLSQAAIVHTVFTRVHGGDATLGGSIRKALSFIGPLFVWSLITSTVGIILHIISERSKLLGRVVAYFLGVGWRVLTYFTIPVIVLEKQTAVTSIKRSGSIFRTTWGETFISNISLGVVFFVAHILVFIAFFGVLGYSIVIGSTVIGVLSLLFIVVWFIGATLVHEVLNGILKTLLYVYATQDQSFGNFDRELLSAMLQRSSDAPASSVAMNTVSPASPSSSM